MNQPEKGNAIIVEISAAIGVCVYLAKLLNLSVVVSLLFAISIVCVAANYFFLLFRRKKMKLEDLATFACVLIAVLLSEWKFSFDYLKPAIIVLCCVFCIDQSPTAQLSDKAKRNILILFEVAVLITNVMYYFGGLKDETYGSTSAIALNFPNPNETAMWITSIVLILLNGVPEQKSVIHRLFLIICAISMMLILWKTESRNCIIVLAFFLLLGMVRWNKKKGRYSSLFLLIVSLSPAITYFAYQYLFIPFYSYLSSWFSFLAWGGKDLTSRNEVWSVVQKFFWKCLLVGKYQVFYSEQLHNALATLFCRFGLVFVVIVCRKFYKAINKTRSGKQQLAMCALWLMGCFETGFFTGAGGLYLMILIMPLFGEAKTEAYGEKRKYCSPQCAINV
jgi:hypothetical protein